MNRLKGSGLLLGLLLSLLLGLLLVSHSSESACVCSYVVLVAGVEDTFLTTMTANLESLEAQYEEVKALQER